MNVISIIIVPTDDVSKTTPTINNSNQSQYNECIFGHSPESTVYFRQKFTNNTKLWLWTASVLSQHLQIITLSYNHRNIKNKNNNIHPNFNLHNDCRLLYIQDKILQTINLAVVTLVYIFYAFIWITYLTSCMFYFHNKCNLITKNFALVTFQVLTVVSMQIRTFGL